MRVLTALLFIGLGIFVAYKWKVSSKIEENERKEFLEQRSKKPHPYDYIKMK